MSKVYDTPSNVAAEAGEVLVDGPDGVDVSLTPEAAGETSDRLLAASAQAAGQQVKAKRLAAEIASKHAKV